ncbi:MULTISPECIES: iron ABC transporter permease [unclassified Solwaraspora]|uniref:iron ABC transporter permease n=1 Tax=unclassified Solwaraspora TaxID=2627926 RepID=UPI00259B5BFB|nr:iron ABC transporter permease [Solwaraspora sp. WMMA2056]WJK38602.1 iron ABC transporter permease [Solwaraspora sp. WMMA2056]
MRTDGPPTTRTRPAPGTATSSPVAVPGPTGRTVLGGVAALLSLALALIVAAGWHLTQGTAGLGPGELLGAFGDDSGPARDILVGSRLPRLAAGVAVGFALGVAGAMFQSLSRNTLASPDTLAVTGGAYFAVSAVAAFGLAVPLWASGTVAFVGGLLAAAAVLGLAGGAGSSTTRLVLAGSVVAMALQAATAALLISFQEETTGLFAWGSGSLSQLGLTTFQYAAPVVAAATVGALLLARRLDVLGVGDDTAAALGVPVRSTRAAGTVLAVLLTAAAVTLAGPIGFVGLCAPAITRLLARAVPALHRHAVGIPAAGLVGALTVVGADLAIRALLGADRAGQVPTGVTTTLAGAVVLVLLARRVRDSGPTRQPPGSGMGPRSRRRFWLVLAAVGVATGGTALLGLLAGNTWLLTGDIALWASGEGPPMVRFALDERAPRVAAALVAGGALALSGCLVQATCRNPLAEPGILGITGGAGLAAVIVVTAAGGGGTTTLAVAATVGALAAFGLVYAIAWRGGLHTDRLVLVGIGVWYATTALTTYLLVRSNPWDTPRIYTWLSGTTYGRSWAQVVPAVIALLVALPVALAARRELDLLALDEDTPRLVGVGLERLRLLVLAVAAVLAAMSVTAVGVVGFVGLVAPHAARALVGGRHARIIPVAAGLGVVGLGVADTIGRTVLAPAQLPAGLVVALVGAPYFIYLLARSRA